MDMNTILLTGSSGYIGRALAPRLKAKGWKVIGLDRRPAPAAALDGFIHGDLREPSCLERIPAGIDAVFHLAAAKDDWGLSDEEYFDDNVNATRKLLAAGAARGVKNWLFFSSVAVLGPSAVPLSEAAPLAPQGAYGESKSEGEKLFHGLAANHPSMRVTIVRPSVVFGAGNPPNTNVYRLIDALYRNRFVMVGKGEAIKTTSYIENLIAATVFLVERMARGVQTFIYVDEPKFSTADMVREICALLEKPEPRWNLPLGIAAPLAHLADVAALLARRDLPITAARIKKFCRPTNFDAAKLRALEWRQPVSMKEALRRSVEWYLRAR